MNYIQAEDSPIVFHDLDLVTNELVFAGTRRHRFDPSRVFVSKSLGRLYHPLPEEGQLIHLPGQFNVESPRLGLLKSSLVLSRLSDDLDMDAGTLTFNNSVFKINWFE